MATTRTDPLTLEVVELIGTVVARYYEEYDRAAAAHSLTGAQARVLGLLSLEPTPMRRIAQKLKCEPSNVTRPCSKSKRCPWMLIRPRGM